MASGGIPRTTRSTLAQTSLPLKLNQIRRCSNARQAAIHPAQSHLSTIPYTSRAQSSPASRTSTAATKLTDVLPRQSVQERFPATNYTSLQADNPHQQAGPREATSALSKKAHTCSAHPRICSILQQLRVQQRSANQTGDKAADRCIRVQHTIGNGQTTHHIGNTNG